MIAGLNAIVWTAAVMLGFVHCTARVSERAWEARWPSGWFAAALFLLVVTTIVVYLAGIVVIVEDAR